MAKYSTSDSYTQDGVLKNKLGITEGNLLERAEADISALRAAELTEKPVPQTFDMEHLKALHRHLFQDVYEWAGQIRTVDISKGETRFANFPHIEVFAKDVFGKLAAEDYLKGLDPDSFAERAAYYLGEINAMHPFREGNGRAGRELIKDLARNAGYVIEFQNVDDARLLDAMIQSFHESPEKLRIIIRENLRPLDDEPDKD